MLHKSISEKRIEFQVEKFPPEVEARAVIEHQCLAKRFYAEQIGYKANGRGEDKVSILISKVKISDKIVI